MSTHYVIDGLTSPSSSSDLHEVRYGVTSSQLAPGNFIYRIPDGPTLSAPPTDIADLRTKKYQALLAYYAGFTTIVYDDMVDPASYDATNSPGATSGSRMTVRVHRPSGVFRTAATPIGVSAPSQFLCTWEVFQNTYTDPLTGRASRVYTEAALSNLTCAVSFNGGTSFTAAGAGALVNIAGGDQGTSLVVRFTNSNGTAGQSHGLGSWAVLF